MFFVLTEEERAEFRRIRLEQYNSLTYEQKIEAAEFALFFSKADGHLDFQKIHLQTIIELMTQKIKERHCLAC